MRRKLARRLLLVVFAVVLLGGCDPEFAWMAGHHRHPTTDTPDWAVCMAHHRPPDC